MLFPTNETDVGKRVACPIFTSPEFRFKGRGLRLAGSLSVCTNNVNGKLVILTLSFTVHELTDEHDDPPYSECTW